MANRTYTSRRMAIVSALVDKIKLINGNFPFRSNLYNNVEPKLLFWDEVQDFPAVHISAGSETRDYQGGGYKDRFMTLTLRIYVQEENANFALEKLFEDVETVIEDNSALSYTDEGALEPLGVGEIVCEVRY